MTPNFKKKLLLGAAGAALVSGGITIMPTQAFAANEIQYTNDDSTTYGTTANTKQKIDADNPAGRDYRIAASKAAAEIRIDGALTIGDEDAAASKAALTAVDNNATLTLTATTASDIVGKVDGTTDGAIVLTTGNAALNLIVQGNDTAANKFTLNVDGTIDLGSGSFTIVDGGGATKEAIVKASGDITATGGIELKAAGANDDSVQLILDGTSGQTITGTIDGDNDNEGDLLIQNTDTTTGVVFANNVGSTKTLNTVEIGAVASDTKTTFKGDLHVETTITVGNAANAETHTLIFDATGGDTSVEGTIDAGGNETDVVNLTIQGGTSGTARTVTFQDKLGQGQNLDTLTVTGNTTAVFEEDVYFNQGATIGSGSTIDFSKASFTNEFKSIDGASAGVGTLKISESGALDGEIGNTTGIAAINILAGKTLEVEGDTASIAALDIKATTITLAGDNSILKIDADDGAAVTVTGNIAATTDGKGEIVIEDGGTETITFTGNVGASTANSLELFDTGNGGNNATIVLQGNNIYVDTFKVNDADVAQFTGTGATVSSNFLGVGDAEGIIRVGDASKTASNVTFTGVVGTTAKTVDLIDVKEGATAVLSGTSSEFDAIKVDGTLTLGQEHDLTTADYTAGSATGQINITIGTDGTTDKSATIISGAALELDELDGTDNNTSTLNLVKGTGVITNNQEFVIAQGGGVVQDMVDNTAESVTDNFALIDFQLFTGDSTGITLGGNNDIVARASLVDTSTVTVNSNNAAAASAVISGVSVAEYKADTVLASVYDSVTGASLAQIDERVEAVQPTVDGGNVAAGVAVNTETAGVVNTQLASLREGNASGMTAGNMANGLRGWAQVFGETGEQDARDGIDGYEIDTYGLTVGLDTSAIADRWIWGLAFSYADSEVDSANANRTNTEIDTYQFTVYGNYDVDEATYVAGQLSYAFGDNETFRQDVGGVAGVNARGDFDSDTFGARVEAGRAYEAGTNATITPKVMLNYVHYDADDYTETGAGGAGLGSVDSDALNILELGIGATADWLIQQSNGAYLKPELRLGVRYDVIGDEIDTTSSFAGTTFQTDGFDAQEFAVDLGAGVTYFSTANWDFTANYDYEYKEDFDSHSGTLRAAYKF